MLCRVGKLVYLPIFVVIVFVWTQCNPESGEVIHHGWEATRQKFADSGTVADKMFDQAYFHARSSSVTTRLSSSISPSSATPTSSTSTTSFLVSTTDSTTKASFLEPSPYAYVFYATEDNYACSVLVNIQRLQDVLHTQHRIFVLISEGVSLEYIRAFEQRNAIVSVQTPPTLAEGASFYYAGCLLKLLAFKMHHIDPSLKKVISMDSDQLIMQNLDHLFESTVEVDLAAPRAYWIAKETITSAFMLITLSDRLWDTVDYGIKTIGFDKYDMDLVNDLFGETVMMLPGSFVTLTSHWEDWNLPKFFHPNTTVNSTKASTTKNLSSAPNPRPTARFPIDRLEHSASPIGKRQQSSTERHSKQGNQEEQIRASSGDIFSYLDKPIESLKEPEDVVPSTYGTPVEPIPPNEVLAETNEYDVPMLQSGSNEAIVKADNAPEDTDMAMEDTDAPPAAAVYEQPLKEQQLTLAEMEQQPLFGDLYDLASAVPVLHFSALGKPWSYTLNDVALQRPGAHPLFVEQFRVWRETALHVCPTGILTEI